MIPAARLEVLRQLLEAASEEMGEALVRSAASANIKERRDLSCALFTPTGQLLAQAEHIPVHLGSMASAVRGMLAVLGELPPGSAAISNDPFHGGTHLPDVTLAAPVHVDGRCVALLAARAHHADIGGIAPGSMPAGSRRLDEEGIVIPPALVAVDGAWRSDVVDPIVRASRTPGERRADLDAQLGALALGRRRVGSIVGRWGSAPFADACGRLLDHAEALMRARLAGLPGGPHEGHDVLDDDGAGTRDLPVRVRVAFHEGSARLDFSGTAPQCDGNLNAPRPVTDAAVQYALRVLVAPDIPSNGGTVRPVEILVPPGSLLDPRPGAAVAGGNVETSQRIVDVLFQALAAALPQRVPACSQGTMNNLAIGGTNATGRAWAYYETLGGGEGGTPRRAGMSGVHTHMTNTRNTPVEALEMAFPVLVRRSTLRRGSGGGGARAGGDGILREIQLLDGTATLSLITERRTHAPPGLGGGLPGTPGRNVLVRGGREEALLAKATVELRPGDRVRLETPGGGGWGAAPGVRSTGHDQKGPSSLGESGGSS